MKTAVNPRLFSQDVPMKFSANLGMLWQDRPLPEAIIAAADAGFEAVEFHWPYDHDPAILRKLAEQHGMAILSVNTRRGGGDRFGLCALPKQEAAALAAVEEAVKFAAALGGSAIHAMAGRTDAPEADAAFRRTLEAAIPIAEAAALTILIEPINTHDVPGYFLSSPEQAAVLIDRLASPSLKMMYDGYHAGRMERDISADLERFLPIIGHVQIAAVPDRGEPDQGEVDYRAVLDQLHRLGYDGYIGAEYRPRQTTDAGLDWLPAWKDDHHD